MYNDLYEITGKTDAIQMTLFEINEWNNKI